MARGAQASRRQPGLTRVGRLMTSSSDLTQPIRPDELASAIAWLADGARSAARSQDVLAELCARLVDCGLPLWRVAVFVRTLHPLLMGRSFVWRPDSEVVVSEAPFQLAEETEFLTSPVQQIYKTGKAIRRRLADPDCPDDFPFLAELRAEGDQRLSRAAARLHQRRNSRRDIYDAASAGLLRRTDRRARGRRPAACEGRGSPGAARHRHQPAQRLCRTQGRRAHPRRTHPPRRRGGAFTPSSGSPTCAASPDAPTRWRPRR